MNLNKIKTYMGFAIKSRQIVFGVDSIKEKNVHIIIYSKSLSESSKSGCVKVSEKNNCKVYEILDEEMFTLVNNEKIKAFAILNQELAKAIENNM